MTCCSKPTRLAAIRAPPGGGVGRAGRGGASQQLQDAPQRDFIKWDGAWRQGTPFTECLHRPSPPETMADEQEQQQEAPQQQEPPPAEPAGDAEPADGEAQEGAPEPAEPQEPPPAAAPAVEEPVVDASAGAAAAAAVAARLMAAHGQAVVLPGEAEVRVRGGDAVGGGRCPALRWVGSLRRARLPPHSACLPLFFLHRARQRATTPTTSAPARSPTAQRTRRAAPTRSAHPRAPCWGARMGATR